MAAAFQGTQCSNATVRLSCANDHLTLAEAGADAGSWAEALQQYQAERTRATSALISAAADTSGPKRKYRYASGVFINPSAAKNQYSHAISMRRDSRFNKMEQQSSYDPVRHCYRDADIEQKTRAQEDKARVRAMNRGFVSGSICLHSALCSHGQRPMMIRTRLFGLKPLGT